MAGWILPTTTNTSNYLKVSLAYLAVFFAYYPTTEILLDRWLQFDESLSHGLLIIAMSIHLVVKKLGLQKESETATHETSIRRRALPLIALTGASLAWLIASLGNINIVEQMLMPLVLLAFLASILGLKAGLAIAPSVLFIYFAIPLWDYFNPLLVSMSSATVTNAVELVGIPALINSNTITLPYGSLVIADGCSGLRYFTIALALSVYLILDSKPNLKASISLLVGAVLLSLFSNWLRIFLITIIAYQTDMESSLVADHETFGWFIFAGALAPLFFLGRRFKALEAAKESTPLEFSIKHGAPALALLALTPFLAYTLTSTPSTAKLNNWAEMGYSQLEQKPNFPIIPNAKLVLTKRANNIYVPIEGFKILNWQESADQSIVPYWPSTFSHNYWAVERTEVVHSENELKDDFQLLELKHKLKSARACLAYNYRVGNYVATSYHKAKLLQIPAILAGQNQFTSTLFITKPVNSSCENLKTDFIKAFIEFDAPIFKGQI
jgi:exosortase